MNILRNSLAVSLFATSMAFAQIQPVVKDNQGSGSVDWASRVIVVTGLGAPNPSQPAATARPGAERAAQMIALRNALETVKGIYLNSSTTIENFMTTSDVVSTSVSGFVKGFQQKGRTKYMSDGTVEITMEIPLDGIGSLGEVLLGESIGETPSRNAFEGTTGKSEMIFSGLIIDCRGQNVKPALNPRVLDPEGREIYGSAYVSKEWVIKHGMVGYAKEIDAAAKLERIGETPGQIKAVKASGSNSTDIVLSAKDAEDVRSSAKNLKFLSECRVVFVID